MEYPLDTTHIGYSFDNRLIFYKKVNNNWLYVTQVEFSQGNDFQPCVCKPTIPLMKINRKEI